MLFFLDTFSNMNQQENEENDSDQTGKARPKRAPLFLEEEDGIYFGQNKPKTGSSQAIMLMAHGGSSQRSGVGINPISGNSGKRPTDQWKPQYAYANYKVLTRLDRVV